MVLFRPTLLATMMQCLALVLVCLLFAPGARAIPQFGRVENHVTDAVPNPDSNKGSGLGTWTGSEADTNDPHGVIVDAASSSSSSATASASAVPSQSTNGAPSAGVPAALLFSAAASAVFLVL